MSVLTDPSTYPISAAAAASGSAAGVERAVGSARAAFDELD